ncbi:MAG: hypothetical protein M1818_002531 [Claussenomyces sp. TS43310]|nr:MAG: hypothetical protein M1818_002531 [Claussenomyces sp. TS43310]
MDVFARAALLVCFFLSIVNAIPTISSQGAKLFTSEGNQFYIKDAEQLTLVTGVAYQGSPNDPLVDSTQCAADAALMTTLGTNSIRVYHVDPSQDHDGCMKIFADAGIYIWLDLDTFTTYILQVDENQDTPYWNAYQYSMYAQVMDVFIQYDNLAGFWIANEAINTAAGSAAAPYIKAAVADMKAYRDAKGYRQVPIGYSAADIAELRPMLQYYLACGDDASQAIDFFGLNSYEWCAINTFNGSGYNVLQDEAAAGGLPIFFSETGCNVGGERSFDDQDAILGPDMVGTWSGAIIYEWVQETNDYGLVNYGNGALVGTPTTVAPDFQNLANHWKTLTPDGVSKGAYTSTVPRAACPSSTAGGWLVNGGVPLPTLGTKAVTSISPSSVAAAPLALVTGPATSSAGTPTSIPSTLASLTTSVSGSAFSPVSPWRSSSKTLYLSNPTVLSAFDSSVQQGLPSTSSDMPIGIALGTTTSARAPPPSETSTPASTTTSSSAATANAVIAGWTLGGFLLAAVPYNL